MTMDNEQIRAEAQKVFFAAMLAGYANSESSDVVTTKRQDGCSVIEFAQSDMTKIKSPDHYTTIEFTQGNYRVVDRYCTTPNTDHSAGTTTIFYADDPIWWMSYAGFYAERVIPFLKEALQRAYEESSFRGGRGPRIVRKDDPLWIYQNRATGNFCHFKGREEIRYRTTLELLGFHEYLGMSLI